MIKKHLNRLTSKAQMSSMFASIVVFIFSSFILYTLIGLTSNDAEQYYKFWHSAQGHSFFEMFSQSRFEFGSLFVLWSLATPFSAHTMFFFTGFAALTAKFYLFKRYLNYPLIAFFAYSLTFIHVLESNQVRAALSVCVIFYALFVPTQKIYTYFLLAIVASLFHYSGIIILALYFVRWPLVGLSGIVLLGFISDFIILSSNLSFAKIWLSNPVSQVNLTNSLFIMQVCISIVCLLYWNTLSKGQKKGAYLNMIGVCVYMSFLDNALVAHRVRELSQIGIFSILFLGPRKLSYVKLWSVVFFAYIIAYNVWLIFIESLIVLDVV